MRSLSGGASIHKRTVCAAKILASIPMRLMNVRGAPDLWWFCDAADPQSREIAFAFTITDDGNVNYLLICESLDKAYFSDTWHETMENAIEAAEQIGINRKEWFTGRR
jgi:hypothetical protein